MFGVEGRFVIAPQAQSMAIVVEDDGSMRGDAVLIDAVEAEAKRADRQVIGPLVGEGTYRYYEHIKSPASIAIILGSLLTPSAVWTGNVPLRGESVAAMIGTN